ncbi:glycosyltransferase [Parerythrobacter lacustris]|uniref:Glycosyltransferase n=1 Tax=Parerythrobacter lacustris TaxID=2969984 RepID=A0ABT1XMV5_9SPHN|nr:glycosyltransferase [Parerythrobacter lacustris]MCR2832917.1 glycosyltransferase [Parerythrobacter lacustris]
MKRVLSISTLYPNSHAPRFGTFVARSLEALAKRGDWKVSVVNPIGIPPIAFGKYKPLAAAAIDGIEHGVEIFRPKFTLIPRFGARSNPSNIARKILPLVERLHAQQPFALVDAQFFYPDGPAAAWIAERLGLPLSIKARGSDITFWGAKDFAREQMLHAAARATGLIAVSQALADDMVALGMSRRKIALNYTGLDRDRFRPLGNVALRSTLSKELGIALPATAPVFSTVGALVQHKGQDLVIGALAKIAGAHLVLVGKGEDERHLRNLAQDLRVADRVHFTGSVDHDLLPLILSTSDAMVLPSAREGLANAWVEALACGTPIVISDVGGARELLTAHTAGVIVERTVEAVAQGMEQVLAAKADPQAVAAFAERFSWDRNAADLAAHFERLTGSG